MMHLINYLTSLVAADVIPAKGPPAAALCGEWAEPCQSQGEPASASFKYARVSIIQRLNSGIDVCATFAKYLGCRPRFLSLLTLEFRSLSYANRLIFDGPR